MFSKFHAKTVLLSGCDSHVTPHSIRPTQPQRQLAAVPLLVWLVTVVTPPLVAAGFRFCQLRAPRPLSRHQILNTRRQSFYTATTGVITTLAWCCQCTLRCAALLPLLLLLPPPPPPL